VSLSWISIALTFTSLFIWWFGNNQPLGFAIFMAGGILWFVAQKIDSVEKNLNERLDADSKSKSKNLDEEK
jgi:hypothetical protein